MQKSIEMYQTVWKDTHLLRVCGKLLYCTGECLETQSALGGRMQIRTGANDRKALGKVPETRDAPTRNYALAGRWFLSGIYLPVWHPAPVLFIEIGARTFFFAV